MKARPFEYRISFANGECIIKHYYSYKQAQGHSWVLASQRATKCTEIKLITNSGSISIISLR